MASLSTYLEHRSTECKILLVEDNKTMQKIIARQLWDIDITTAASPKEARDKLNLSQGNFELVISDYNLEQGDAFEVISLIRSTPHTSKVPVIVTSASMDKNLSTRLIVAGANNTICKPFDKSVLRDTVLKLLYNPAARDAAGKATTARCFSWAINGVHYVFSPELNVVEEGATIAEAKEKLVNRLRSFNGIIGFTHTEKVLEVSIAIGG